MRKQDIAHLRLHNQLISQQPFETPEQVVAWLCAVQAQDFAAAKWAVGLRLHNVTDDDIEQAYSKGTILRTHLMRPTWHFVAPADIRWLLALTAPRVKAVSAYWTRKLELDNATLMNSNAALIKALQGGKQCTRAGLVSILQQNDIATDDLRFTYLMMQAELDGVVCSGARQGKQHTYALLDERVPQTGSIDREEALATFVGRYFTSHGPATLQDFVWWSGLTVADAKIGLAMVRSQLMYVVVEDQTYWFSASTLPAKDSAQIISLLPNFDEYIVGYKDRDAIFDTAHTHKLDTRGNVLFNHTIVMEGRIIGTWKRTIQRNTVLIVPDFFDPLHQSETLTSAADRYGAFLGKLTNEIIVNKSAQA